MESVQVGKSGIWIFRLKRIKVESRRYSLVMTEDSKY